MSAKNINNIVKTQSVGQLLRQQRLSKGLQIGQAAEATKIRSEFLQALEEGNYSAFASDVYAKGFLKNYARFLAMDVERIMAMYRREAGDGQAVKHRDSLSLEKKSQNTWAQTVLSQRGAMLLGGFLVLLLLGIYFTSQLNALLQPPTLELITPVPLQADFEGEIFVPGNSFQVRGKTAAQTVVRLNSQALELQPGFEFNSKEIPFKGEQLTLILTATNQFGRVSTIKLNVKKGSTGVATADKMSILLEIADEPTAVLARTDGVIAFNDRAFPGDVIALEANQRLQIESTAPYNIKLTINGEVYPFTAQDQLWELIDGKVLQQ